MLPPRYLSKFTSKQGEGGRAHALGYSERIVSEFRTYCSSSQGMAVTLLLLSLVLLFSTLQYLRSEELLIEQYPSPRDDGRGCFPGVSTLSEEEYNGLFSAVNLDSVPEIDAVITWAGLSDEESSDVRTRDNDELKYCLRSIYRHIPWLHRIHIVVNNRTFHDIAAGRTFIDPDPSTQSLYGLNVVNLVDLFCGIYDQCDALENNTNSLSIETTLHRIPALSEHYIYFNDDFFIGLPLHWNFFFVEDGRHRIIPRMPYIMYSAYKHIGFQPTYGCPDTLGFSQQLVPNGNVLSAVTGFAEHMPRPQLKTSWQQFEEQYPEWFRFVRSHKTRFRSCSDHDGPIEEALPLHLMARILQHAEHYDLPLDLMYYPPTDGGWGFILRRMPLFKMWGLEMGNPYHGWFHGLWVRSQWLWEYRMNRMEQPATFNINDEGQEQERIHAYLMNAFPNKSPIES